MMEKKKQPFAASPAQSPPDFFREIDRLYSEYEGTPGALLGLLEKTQRMQPHNYLPKETLEYIASRTRTPLSRIYGLVTFYSFFNLQPQGENCLTVCRGTACHTRGSGVLLKKVKSILKVREDSADENLPVNTEDNKFTVKTVACFGQCALAPVVDLNGKIYGNLTGEKLKKIINI